VHVGVRQDRAGVYWELLGADGHAERIWAQVKHLVANLSQSIGDLQLPSFGLRPCLDSFLED
jgi:hypothetical protein